MITVESLEIHVSNHCNLSCRGCSHISPLEKKEFLNEENMYLVLKKLSSVLHCKVIRLLGGEPTLNSNLENIVSKIKEIGISDEISIPTNGILISKLSENILNNIDIVEISNYNYNEKISKNLIEWAKKNKDKVTTYIYLYDYFREPFSYHKNANKQLVDDIYKTCIISQKWQCFNVYGEYFYKCPQSLAICKNIENCSFDKNGIKILGNQNLEEELEKYINSISPLQACDYCLGTVGKKFKIMQVSKEKYKKEAEKNIEEMLDKEFLKKSLEEDVGDMFTVGKVLKF